MAFGGILRQSTAVDVLIGPFVDSTDGDAEETGLTIAQADVRLSKNGQTGAQKSDVTSAAHDADGFYNCELDATDTNTVGQLTLYVHVAGALAVRHDYQVMEEVPFDALFAASAAGYGTAQTGDSFARLGAPAGASVSADIAAIEAQTDDIGAAGAGLTAVPWNAAWDAEVQSEVQDALEANNLDHLVGTATGIPALPAGTFLDQALDDGTAVFDRTTDSLQAIRDHAATVKTDTAAILTDTADMQPKLGTPAADLAADIAAVKVDTAAILVDTGTTLQAELDGIQADTEDIQARLPAALTAGGNIKADALAVSDKTGYALSATGSAALTEGYAADGAAATLPELLYMILALLSEFAIAATTLTAKKLDGTTTAATFTLDSATTPTSITRAT